MTQESETTAVVIVGGGVAGLALGTFLLRSGIQCTILEKRSRQYVENRQRAGSLDASGVRMLRQWGIEEVVEDAVESPHDDPTESEMPLLIDGEKRLWKLGDSGDDVLQCDTDEFGYAWLTILAEVPADPLATMAVHTRGFAAQITRGPKASRLYLQCPVTDSIEQWPDERIRTELETRFGYTIEVKGPIVSKQVVPLRGVVFSPMSYGRLYLVGDAAHLISPMSAEGMSLALHDAEVLARAVITYIDKDDASLLEKYSDTCLDHTWQRQAAAVWMTQTMHDAGDSSYAGEFRKQIARANLETLVQPSTTEGS
ncbi:Rossmann-fold NAD(P)-binding domain-containing protein [Flindersiella endophytica]